MIHSLILFCHFIHFLFYRYVSIGYLKKKNFFAYLFVLESEQSKLIELNGIFIYSLYVGVYSICVLYVHMFCEWVVFLLITPCCFK